MIFILVLISLITRLSFLSKYLYNWDSAQFALAFDVFNISMHQPHPPGYFLYVAFAKLIDFVLHNANLSYIFENILFFILSSIIFYRLALLVFKNKNKAMVTSLFFIFNPVIWFYGEIAAVYMVDLFFSLLFVYFSWLILIEKDSVRQNFILFSFLLGISGGFRQTLIILFAPLWLLVCFFFFKNSRSIKSFVNVFLEVIIILLIGLLLWLLPTVYLSQGFKNYLDLIQAQFSSAGKFSSLFQEANYNQILTQIKRVTKSLILILNFLLIFLPFGFYHLCLFITLCILPKWDIYLL